jgi:hypothetical protein
MSRSLPPSPSLEQLKKQARDLLNAYRAGDPQAAQRIRTQLRRPPEPVRAGAGSPGILLADALLVVAREHGFASWPKLIAGIEAASLTLNAPVPVSAASERSSERKMTPRRRYVQTLSEELLELARRQETEQLVARLCLPLRDILAVRDWIAASDRYSVLIDALLQGLHHPKDRVRFDSAHLMDHLADERCVEPLRRLLDDPVPRVRRAALHSLSCDACKLAPLPTNDDFVAILVERVLHDPSIRVRRHAVYGLAGHGDDPRAVAALQTLLAQETDAVLLRSARSALQQQEARRSSAG